ncbi:MAG: SDR family NAD(P)-dependent oxidoreductase [Acidimicrobiales bacterium]
MDLQGKTVVITGGSQGIGEHMAVGFAAKGASVLVVARSEDKLRAVAERIGGDHLVADLGSASDVDGLVDACLERLGHIDVWVNNAGLETNDAFADTDRDVVRAVNRLNLEAPMLLTRDVLDHMLPRRSGHIVQISSQAGVVPFPGFTAYCGTKAGLTNFTESLRLELKGCGVGLTVVAPGPVATDMWDRADYKGSYLEPALKRFRILQQLPIIPVEKIAAQAVAAVEGDRRHVRLPRRAALYHALNNLPRRIVELGLIGVKLRRPAMGRS